MKLIKNNFRLGGIQHPPALLDCLSANLSNKGALLFEQTALLGEQFNSIFSFYIKSLFLHSFRLKFSMTSET